MKSGLLTGRSPMGNLKGVVRYARVARRSKRRRQEYGERRILVRPMRQGLVPESAQLVRGSFRRIMTMRFRPANISVIIVDAAQRRRLLVRTTGKRKEGVPQRNAS